MTRVSVVIPCYNQGHFVDDAVSSVLAQTFADFEIIIINDGSTDEATNRLLSDYNRPKTRVLHTRNQGLGAARNNGIREATGDYILPLDADDRIASTYVEKAVKILDTKETIGIVYAEADLFGERTGKWQLAPYRFPDILLTNVIFCSAFFRKSDWETVGGYRTDYEVWEDYDFWLSLIELGRDVHRIPEILFHYRRHTASMIVQASPEKLAVAYARIMTNHLRLYSENALFMAQHMMALRGQAMADELRIRQLEEEVADMRRSRFWKLRNGCKNALTLFGSKPS